MNALYLINYMVFAAFITTFVIELGFALLILTDYKKYGQKAAGYIKPIWEANATFGVFYLVNTELTYPLLLTTAAALYITPLLLAAALIIIKNAFLAYGEYIGDKKSAEKSFYIYAACMVAIAILIFSVLGSAFTGHGVSLSHATASIWAFVNTFNALIIISAVIIALAIASAVVEDEEMLFGFKGGILVLLVFLIDIAGIYLYSADVGRSMGQHIIPLAASLALLLAYAGAVMARSRRAKYVLVAWLFISVLLLGFVEYPYIFGMQNVGAYVGTGAIAGPAILISTIGGTLVAIAIAYLLYMSYVSKAIPRAGSS